MWIEDSLTDPKKLAEVFYAGMGFMMCRKGAFEKVTYPWFEPAMHEIEISKDFSSEDVSLCWKWKDAGVKVFKVKNENNMMIHMLRFLHIYNFLKLYGHEYRYVITTDVRDVIFQTNPSDYVQNVFGSRSTGIMAQSEAIKIKDEAWNRDNIIKNFGQYFFVDVMENEVYNVGILAGTTEYIKDLCFHLYQLSSNRPDWVADQAAYNIMLNMLPYNDGSYTHFSQLSDGWTCNLHVTNKPDQLEEFGPHLLEPRPVFKDGQVVTGATGQPYVIVHQYDRVPEWKEYFYNKYGVEDESQYFTYKI